MANGWLTAAAVQSPSSGFHGNAFTWQTGSSVFDRKRDGTTAAMAAPASPPPSATAAAASPGASAATAFAHLCAHAVVADEAAVLLLRSDSVILPADDHGSRSLHPTLPRYHPSISLSLCISLSVSIAYAFPFVSSSPCLSVSVSFSCRVPSGQVVLFVSPGQSPPTPTNNLRSILYPFPVSLSVHLSASRPPSLSLSFPLSPTPCAFVLLFPLSFYFLSPSLP